MTIKIFNDQGKIWCLRIIRNGDKYGLNDCLTCGVDQPLIEFFDTRYEHTPLGQFVTRYYVETLLDREPGGLLLDAGNHEWSVTANGMERIRNWLSEECEP